MKRTFFSGFPSLPTVKVRIERQPLAAMELRGPMILMMAERPAEILEAA